MRADQILSERPAPVAPLPPWGIPKSVTFSMARSVIFSMAIDRLGSERHEHWPVSAGVVASARMEDGRCGNTGSQVGAVRAATGTPRGADWAGVVADGPVLLRTRGNARRGKGP